MGHAADRQSISTAKVTSPSVRPGPSTITIRPIFHERNQGKGGGLQTGFAAICGDVLVIQDADLEYDPNDWEQMYELIAKRKVADVVFGSRFYGRPHRSLYFHHYLANRLISFLFNLLFNQTLTDIEVVLQNDDESCRQVIALDGERFRHRSGDKRRDRPPTQPSHL